MTTAEKIAWLRQAPARELITHYNQVLNRRNRTDFGAEYLELDEDMRLAEEEMLRRMKGEAE